MDITFEDVAHVIQDARYQQAIVNTAPMPDKKIKVQTKNFDPEKFMEDISIKTMVTEPLGRFFLEKYADCEEIRPDKIVRDVDGKMHHILNFVEEMYNFRRRDQDNLIELDDLVILLQKYNLQDMFDDAMGAESDSNFDSLLREFEEHRNFDNMSFDESFDGYESFDGSVVEGDLVDVMMNRESMVSMTSKTKKKRITATGVDTTVRESVVNTHKPYNGESVNGLRTDDYFTGAASSSGAGSNAQPVRSRLHSWRTKQINELVDKKVESICQPLFDQLLEDKYVLAEYCKFKEFSQRHIGDRNIHYHRVLGQGAFGTVYGCLISQIGVMMAMKILVKKKVKIKRAKNQVKAERDALQALAEHPSPYCIQLRYAFETSENFHLIIPLAVGGDLKYHLKGGKKFDLERARIYCAQIAYGLGHLHNLDMIMRDLKPRNVLLDSEGFCRISDFGLVARISGDPISGRAGTEGYWSPEVINGKTYSVDADWWSYGCCVFELIAGFNPFSTKHTKNKTRNEGTRSGKIKFPSDFPKEAKPLVMGLLNMNPAERLGCRGGVNEVMKQGHPFWKPLNLRAVRNGEGPIPWKPEKGRIYALGQQEMVDMDDDANYGANMRKVKLTDEDVPEFHYYIDNDSHQRDIIKVIPLNTEIPRLKMNTWDGTYVPKVSTPCCTIG